MAWKGLLKGSTLDFVGEQEMILKEYFNKGGRVCVSAGAGTGKTSLLVEIYAEAIVRMLEERPDENPFERVLAITFTIEAARQMKTRVRERLEKHLKSEEKGDPGELLRHLESTSWIMTLDSLTRQLYSEIALDAGLNPVNVVPDVAEIAEVKEEIVAEIQSDVRVRLAYQQVSIAYPESEWQARPGWKTMLDEAFEDCRQYGLSASEFETNATTTLNERLYLGIDKKRCDQKLVDRILAEVLGAGARQVDPERVKKSYAHNLSLLKSFCQLLEYFEERYDVATKSKGWLSHDDARYWLLRYIWGSAPSSDRDQWLSYQASRFKHILIDEFQDTSYGQCEVIKIFIGAGSHLLIIGDPKQAIYQWRSADPSIFLDIIKTVSGENGREKEIPHLGAAGVFNAQLSSNYRSVSQLIDLYNDLFGSNSAIFSDARYTGGYPIPHQNLVTKTSMPSDLVSQPIIHPMRGGKDAEIIASELERIQNKEKTIWVREEVDGATQWRKAEIGDCCVLMQTRGKWPELRNHLIQRGISYTMIGEKGLFTRPEISLIIDFMDWLGNPHKKDALARILRSPLVGISDRALRYVASHDFYLNRCVNDAARPQWFDSEALREVEMLMDLRDDLRWSREGKKNELIEKILKYSHLDTVLLSHGEGDQIYANIRYFQDIVAQWEEEDLLSYDDLLSKMKYLREEGAGEYNLAALADEEDQTSVKIATVHAIKGLEFPVVFHLHTRLNCDNLWTFTNGDDLLFTKQFGKFISLAQLPPPGCSRQDWEALFAPGNRNAQPSTGEFGDFNREYYAERWRLFYVAMTRARDHVYFNPVDMKDPTSWAHWLSMWFKDHQGDPSIDFEIVSSPSRRRAGEITTVSFDVETYQAKIEDVKGFIPSTINPSHIYDIVFCPRRYQYQVLQQVKGGPHGMEGKGVNNDAIQFGNDVHKALELLDFKSSSINEECQASINEAKQREEVELAIQKFQTSDLKEKYGLDKNRVEKEMLVLHLIQGEKCQIMTRDRIDLVIHDSRGTIMVDYKTAYPKGERIGERFTREHYRYQLGAYAQALIAEMRTPVKSAVIFHYDRRTHEWEDVVLDLEGLDVEKTIVSLLPLKVEEGGLQAIPRKEFCTSFCEFNGLCKPKF